MTHGGRGMRTTIGLAMAAALLVAACATKPEPPPRPFAGTRWFFILDRAPAGEPLWVQFADGRLEGFAGCNRFHARYVQDAVGARAIAVGVISKVPRLCEADRVALESRLLEVLQSVSSYSVTADLLTMSGSAGSLKFRAAP